MTVRSFPDVSERNFRFKFEDFELNCSKSVLNFNSCEYKEAVIIYGGGGGGGGGGSIELKRLGKQS